MAKVARRAAQVEARELVPRVRRAFSTGYLLIRELEWLADQSWKGETAVLRRLIEQTKADLELMEPAKAANEKAVKAKAGEAA